MENKNLALLLALAVAALYFWSREAEASDEMDGFFTYDSLIKNSSRKWGVPWRWIKAICIVESDLGRAASVARGISNPYDADGSKSFDGKSWGLAQVTLTTARDLRPNITVADLNTPSISIDLCAQYLARLIRIFGLDPTRVPRAYNGGPGYASTVAGPALTAVYLARWEKALARVLEAQPGNPLEVA